MVLKAGGSTTCYLLLATYCVLLATCYWLLTTYYLLFKQAACTFHLLATLYLLYALQARCLTWPTCWKLCVRPLEVLRVPISGVMRSSTGASPSTSIGQRLPLAEVSAKSRLRLSCD